MINYKAEYEMWVDGDRLPDRFFMWWERDPRKTLIMHFASRGHHQALSHGSHIRWYVEDKIKRIESEHKQQPTD